jgi:hypothetical protein
MTGRHSAVESRDTGAVRVAVRVAEFGVDASFKTLGDEVFQALGLAVELVEVIVEHTVKKSFDKAVMTDDLQRTAAAEGGQADPAMAFVFDQRVLGCSELLEHVGDRSGGDPQALRQGGRADAAALCPAKGEDGFQIVVNGFASPVDAWARAMRHGPRFAAAGRTAWAESAGHGYLWMFSATECFRGGLNTLASIRLGAALCGGDGDISQGGPEVG